MELKEIIEKIDSLKQEIDDLGPLSNDAKERLEQKVRMEWNYHSNVMEGNQLDYGETRSLLLWGITAKGKPLKDHLDLEGHNEAIKKLEGIASKDITITESLIVEFHRLILAEPFDEYRKDILVGKYKRENNYLYNERDERVDFCPPEEVPKRLNDLINWTNNAISPPKRKKRQYDVHPLLIATRFHLEFINIHPFDDGNGRLCRIFMNLILMQCGYPPIIVPTDLRTQYFAAIEESREKGIEVLATFLGEQLIKSLELYLKVAKGGSAEDSSDLDKEIALLELKLKSNKIATLSRTEDVLKITYTDSILPLFMELEDVQRKFSKFFLNPGCRYEINHQPYHDLKSIDDILLGKNIEHPFSFMQLYEIKSWYYLNDFQMNGTNPFSVHPDIVIRFENLKYVISSERVKFEPYERLYSDPLKEADIKAITVFVGNYILNQIKERTTN